MSFFKKLKDRLFRSSSKIEEGIESIIEDGEEDKTIEKESFEDLTTAFVEKEPLLLTATEEVPSKVALDEVVTSALTEEVPSAVAVDEVVTLATTEEVPSAGALDEVVTPALTEGSPSVGEALHSAGTTYTAKRDPFSEIPTQVTDVGFLGRLIGRKPKQNIAKRELDDKMLEALEELLISSDMGVDTAIRVTANMAEGNLGKKLSTSQVKSLLSDEITSIMSSVAKPLPLYQKRPQVVLVVGVNGSGKTTTIGKLAFQFKKAGKKVLIVAGDTFRAAAVEQLQIWGDRADVAVLSANEGSDPASLVFDSMEKAEKEGIDLLLIDTAGRLQNRTDLMEELAKIVRVIKKKDSSAPHNTLLVLDATTGQNALNQVGVFKQISEVSGLVMTKLDGTAKGGVLVALADKFGLPIHAIGVGEQIDDLAPFDAREFAMALTGHID
jgi:fused signal recognition particle receptor